MRNLLLILLLAMANFAASAPPHDFHVSITRIDFNPDTQSLEVTLKIFTDDFEKALETATGSRIHLGTPKEHSKTEQYIREYLTQKFFLLADGKAADPVWVGREVEFDVTWCYIEFPLAATPKSIEVTNKILTETFDDQSNLIHLYKGEEKRTLMLNRDLVSGTVEF